MGTAEVLVFGASSLVGSHFVERSGLRVAAAGRKDPSHPDMVLDRFQAVDLLDLTAVEDLVRSAPEPLVVNFAARTEVDLVERERAGAGSPTDPGPTWIVNTLAPEAMARAARSTRKHFVQVSTDFVFDGRSGPYEEGAPRSPFSPMLCWYGWTKSEGERRVEVADPTAAILRIAYPYRSRFPAKLDFARGMIERRRRGALPPLYHDQHMTPTWIPDVTRALVKILASRESGVFHAASPEVTTPFDFASELFKEIEGRPPGLLKGSIAEALQKPGAVPRPQDGGLACARLATFGVSLTTWRDGIRQLVREEGWA